jgi:hypothetical protein
MTPRTVLNGCPGSATGQHHWVDPEMSVGHIVESIPAMAAIAVELQRTHDQWAPGVHLNDLDFEAAALVAYQAMGKFPPTNMQELLLWVLGVLPEAEISEDDEGQLIIHTGLRTGEPTPADHGGMEASEALESFL